MQEKLGNFNKERLEFGDIGSPTRQCFSKKLKSKRIDAHIRVLLRERLGDSNIDKEVFDNTVSDQVDKMKKTLRLRGYQLR